ncbi:MAG: DUF4335 domain-containing protein [Cyanobacteria bacterium P01_H01_bin.15]
MTTLRRQYISPNCNLTLEGLAGDTPAGGLPSLETLLHAECQILGIQTLLSGGRTFLENLVNAVSIYSQGVLSGITHPHHGLANLTEEGIALDSSPLDSIHRLRWRPAVDVSSEPITLELTSVQLFDLLETIDQLLADSQTLPNWQLSIEPLSRRFRRAEEPLAQRAQPLALGTVGMAIAAAGIFWLPIPEVRDPALIEERILEETPIESEPNEASRDKSLEEDTPVGEP